MIDFTLILVLNISDYSFQLILLEASMARRNSVSYDSEGRSTKSSSIESLQTQLQSLGNGDQPKTASIKARPTSRRITAQELQEIFIRQGSAPDSTEECNSSKPDIPLPKCDNNKRGLPNRYARRKALYNCKQFTSTPDLKNLEQASVKGRDVHVIENTSQPMKHMNSQPCVKAETKHTIMYKSTESLPNGVLRGSSRSPEQIQMEKSRQSSQKSVSQKSCNSEQGSSRRSSVSSAATLTADIGSSVRLRSSSITLPTVQSDSQESSPGSDRQSRESTPKQNDELSDIEAISSEMDMLTMQMEELCASSDMDKTPKNSPERELSTVPIDKFVAGDGYVNSTVIKQFMVDNSDSRLKGKKRHGQPKIQPKLPISHESDSEAEWDLGLQKSSKQPYVASNVVTNNAASNVVTAYNMSGGDMYYSNSLPRNYQRRMMMDSGSIHEGSYTKSSDEPYSKNWDSIDVFIPKPDYDSSSPAEDINGNKTNKHQPQKTSKLERKGRHVQRIRSHSVSECQTSTKNDSKNSNNVIPVAKPEAGSSMLVNSISRESSVSSESQSSDQQNRYASRSPRVSPSKENHLADAIMLAAQAREKRLQEQQKEEVERQTTPSPESSSSSSLSCSPQKTDPNNFSAQHIGALMNAIAKRKSLLDSSSSSDPDEKSNQSRVVGCASHTVPSVEQTDKVIRDDLGGSSPSDEGNSPFGSEFAKKLAARRKFVESHGVTASGDTVEPKKTVLHKTSGGIRQEPVTKNKKRSSHKGSVKLPTSKNSNDSSPSSQAAHLDVELVQRFPTTALPPPSFSPPDDDAEEYYIAAPLEPPEGFRGSPVTTREQQSHCQRLGTEFQPRYNYDIKTHGNYVTKIEVKQERTSPETWRELPTQNIDTSVRSVQEISPEFLQNIPKSVSPDKQFQFSSPPAPVVHTVEEGLEVYDVDLVDASQNHAGSRRYYDCRPTIIKEPLNSSYSSYFSSTDSDDFNTIKRAPKSYLQQHPERIHYAKDHRWSPEAGYHSATPSHSTPPDSRRGDETPDYIAPQFRNGSVMANQTNFSREAYYRHKYGLDDQMNASDDDILTVDLNGSKVSMMVNGMTHEWSSPGGDHDRRARTSIPARRIRSPQTVRKIKAAASSSRRDGRSPNRRQSRSPNRSGQRSPSAGSSHSGCKSPSRGNSRSGHRSPNHSGHHSPSAGSSRSGTKIPVKGITSHRRSKSPGTIKQPVPAGYFDNGYPAYHSYPTSGNIAVHSFREKPIANWAVDDVGDWLDYIKLKGLKQRFIAGQVNGQKLVSWSRQGFAGMGIKFADMALMQQSLHKLKTQRSRIYQI